MNNNKIELEDYSNVIKTNLDIALNFREKLVLRIFSSFNFFAVISGVVGGFGFSAIENVENFIFFIMAEILILGAIIYCIHLTRVESSKSLVELDKDIKEMKDKQKEINNALCYNKEDKKRELVNELENKTKEVCLFGSYDSMLKESKNLNKRLSALVIILSFAFFFLIISFIDFYKLCNL